MDHETEWWQEAYGFFGEHYLKGDNSNEGYLINRKQSLSERTETEVNGIIHLLHLQKGAAILDVPCGYGRHSIGLAKKGYNVVGVDLNSTHLSKALAEAQKKGANVVFNKENMLNINYDQKFDALINMFYSFGFFETDEDNFKVLKNFYKALKKGGQFLFHTDVNIPRIHSGTYREEEIRTLPSGETLKIIDKFDPTTRKINGSWSITYPDGRHDEKHYSVRVYDKEEFFHLCHSVGFTSCKAYSDWDGSPYTPDSEDMIVVAKKA